MAYPAERFTPSQHARAAAEEPPPPRPPTNPQSTGSPQPSAVSGSATPVTPASVKSIHKATEASPTPVTYRAGPVEFDPVAPASNTLAVRGKQAWLEPTHAGITVTLWADHDVIHLSIAGARIKTARSHLTTQNLTALGATDAHPASPPPRPPIEPVTAQRRASNSDVIMIASQKIPLGPTHTHHELTTHLTEHTITTELNVSFPP